jgi:adenine-specific DNA methylase
MNSDCGITATVEGYMLRSRKRLTMWSSLPPYLGGKRRLCPIIFREIDRIVPRRMWRALTFLDAFHGGGSVSLFAKAQGFRVLACDIAERAVIIGRALLENTRVKVTREDVLRLLRAYDGPAGRIETTMAPSTFTKEQARFIDSALRVACETPDQFKGALIRLLAMRMALLCHAYSQVRRGTIHRVTTGEFESITESAVYHYVDGMRLTTVSKLWDLAQQINAGVFEGSGTITKGSVLEVVPELRADVMYADPPYPGVMSYEKEYKVIDEIFEGTSRPTSPFTAKDGANMIDGLFERAQHIPVWVLSLGNAVVGVEELEAKMLRFGRRVKSIQLRYQHLPAVATEEKKATNLEFLVVGVDEALLQAHLGRLDHLGSITFIQDDLRDGGTGTPALEPLAHEALQQGESDLAAQRAPIGSGGEGGGGLDDPRPVVARDALDGDRVLRLFAHGDAGSPDSDRQVKEDAP